MIKEKEYCLSVNNYKQPKVYEKEQAIALLLTRLILLEPGSDPIRPLMGVGIVNYRYAQGKIEELKTRVSDQIKTYLPCFSSPSVEIEITNDKLCNIIITIDETMYVYESASSPIPITLDAVR